MASLKTLFIAAARFHQRAGGILLRTAIIAALLFYCADSARASTSSKKKKTTSTSKSSKSSKTSSKKTAKAKPKVSPDIAQLRPSNYPPEISQRVATYNKDATEVNALRKNDPRMAKARGEVLALQKQSFDLYTSLMSEIDRHEVDKIRKAVSVNGWYKGMPQIAFVVSMGLPDDVESTPQKDGARLKLVYKGSSFYFEKGRLREYQAPK